MVSINATAVEAARRGYVEEDFRAMLRPLADVQDYYNRKGLVDENGKRKAAFYLMQDFYQNRW